MKALFIGGTGTISTDVVALAQQRGWEITLLNRGSKKMPEGIHSIIADINDEEAVAKPSHLNITMWLRNSSVIRQKT